MIRIMEQTTKLPITEMGRAAGICWGANISDPSKNYARGKDCMEAGHGRVMEFVQVQMEISGYSARVIREWYTHIGGAPTRLQESTRYINYGNFGYVTPPSIEANKEAKELYDLYMQFIQSAVTRLRGTYFIPNEDVAMLLPLGMQTKIVDHRNLRNLIDMSHQRMCSRAYWEYRKLMSDICEALCEYSEEWEEIVKEYFHPKCVVTGYCTEHKTCGKMPRKATK